MKEPESYYDWRSQFKTKSAKANRPKSEKKKVITIGILKEELQIFLTDWKRRNKL